MLSADSCSFLFLSSSSAFFVFDLITYDWSVQTHLLLLLLWVLLLLRVCAGVRGSAWVCASVCGCAWVCVCVRGYARVCKGVCGYAQGCAVWASVHKCAQVFVKVCGCLRVCAWDEFSEYLLENRVSTSADFNTYPIRIFSLWFVCKIIFF